MSSSSSAADIREQLPRGSNHSGPGPAPAKRTRVLLSCHTCRASKLKCDRAQPCSQCLKKGRPDECKYAPRPERHKPAKTMAARLKRLEGMVRGMLDEGGAAGVGNPVAKPPEPDELCGVGPGGQVVRGGRTTSYVGGTHFMAILEDIDELKAYFDEPDEDNSSGESPESYETAGSPDFVLLGAGIPRTKEELLALLPEKSVIDRLMVHYFSSNSPSQHIIHRPSFNREYHRFWKYPSKASLHWIALLFMVTGLGIFFVTFAAPHELEGDSPLPPLSRFKQYRGAAGWALIHGKYTQPTLTTLQAFLLYVEAEFLMNRQTQTGCYLLSSVLIRLMLKMGLHRDPSRLPNLSPYDGEMRRRLWNLAIQVDLLVAFHLGLPAMIHGIESDTSLPRNLHDEDFDEDSKELPSSRSSTDYTHMTYAINKAAICRVFGLAARQAHSLKTPTYSEVLRVDGVVEETWAKVPGFMKVKPLEECVTDPPLLVIQRFGLASLYQKSRCVLHRRYLTDVVPNKEHQYSRKSCLEAALALLEYQSTMYEACKPGAMLVQTGWFFSALAINDFLLANMIIALIVQNENYSEDNWLTRDTPTPTKEELIQILSRSHDVWQETANKIPECQKACDVVATLLRRAQGQTPNIAPSTESSAPTTDGVDSMAGLSIDINVAALGNELLAGDDWQALPTYPTPETMYNESQQFSMDSNNWMISPNASDWVHFDVMTRSEVDAMQPSIAPGVIPANWFDNNPMDEMDFIASSSWNQGV